MKTKKLIFTIPIIVSVTLCIAQEILYQGIETDKNKLPTKHNRQPIESEQCLEGEFLYPGDNEKDWVCDCKPIYVYHPETLRCYQVYDQGPCKKGEILVLPPKKYSPKCMRNQCTGSKVYFRGKCVTLNENGGCPGHAVVQVNSTSLQLTCAINFGTRFGEDYVEFATPLNYTETPVDEIGAACLLAGKRSQLEKCNTTST